ncbi:UbiA family prenyltransferase [Aspergillus clavatus NRRL 1]|uniref:UbiA prenyltransferase family protein n=1 Tax=Aspergillus clavatus (strain ATCC 1007 / CBS 513.65 / DSM 816 / NCTC 3887 / NRRL 1 / QM 1276 / 107) TaxID=344612 RepID=A1CQ99_ASPCL|nr:uncharacterized protein ACLA_025370 [Aspergillus clavatus NRRL 1]EAW07820.1 conserved hypothetical protein [Aspergillus clavatus NRRL 1]
MTVANPVHQRLCLYLRTVASSLYTVWLFTANDLQTIIAPSAIFGITNALAALIAGSTENSTQYLYIIQQIPTTICWVWINLLPLTINNQRSPSSIAEDAINKPWRALPSKRLSSAQAKRLMLGFYAVALAYSCFYSGGCRQSIGLIFLGTWYNSYGAGDRNFVVRNIINALGYLCFNSGAVEVALGPKLATLEDKRSLQLWCLVVTGIVLTTMQVQDMGDQEGDAKRGRLTLPLAIGDETARWSIALPMPVWGILCPLLAGVGFGMTAVSCVLAVAVAVRLFLWKDAASDQRTFLVWNCWMSVVYMMPLLRRYA